MEILVEIDALSETAFEWIIDLVEVDGDRKLQIWVGAEDGRLLARAMSGGDAEDLNPSVHRLLVAAVRNLGGHIERAVIGERMNNTYGARLVIRRGVQEFPLFARPIDAILAAVIASKPLLVEESLF